MLLGGKIGKEMDKELDELERETERPKLNAIEKMQKEETLGKFNEDMQKNIMESKCPNDYALSDSCGCGCETCWIKALIKDYEGGE